jgi:hypothetical protein
MKDFYLEQYRQAHEWWRHNDRQAWTMATLFIPVALAILGWAMHSALESWQLWLLGIASVATLALFRVMFHRMSFWTEHRAEPLMRDIESKFKDIEGYEVRSYLGLPREPERTDYKDGKAGAFGYSFERVLHYFGANVLNVKTPLTLFVLMYAGVWGWLICHSYDC